MSFFKHVGMANSKKVIIVQRQLSGDDSHMAAILYGDILPSKYHDDVMKILESDEGQASFEFRDILQRRMMSTGENMLQALSGEGYIKRVAQNAITVKPNSKSSIRLDELVKLLNEAGRGEQAVKRLDAMDAEMGMSNGLPKVQQPDDPSYHYSSEKIEQTEQATSSAAPSTSQMTDLMQQMMNQMQVIQQELAQLKSKPKRSRKATT